MDVWIGITIGDKSKKKSPILSSRIFVFVNLIIIL